YNKSLKEGEKILPQMVIIIDELADLMMVSPGEVEDSICRLAQLARACGMHLVIATQRPSVNVITGIIKANIPTRIAFSVASQVDSRTMIDHGGAEKLLGNGDMLFVPNGMKSMRVQGAWVSDDEVHAIVEYIKQSGEAVYDPDMIEHLENATRSDAEKEEIESEYDPKLAEAVDIAIDLGQVSISMLQRKMRIGYARAGRIIDEMSRRGIVSEAAGSKPRNILITREQANEMFEDCA
ncbi:MAG: DNA translocase FtsK, partial [Oscillospiraceae bacterium]|nr:DNA translocase FtsK [Oscillospiraceae bacterium]